MAMQVVAGELDPACLSKPVNFFVPNTFLPCTLKNEVTSETADLSQESSFCGEKPRARRLGNIIWP